MYHQVQHVSSCTTQPGPFDALTPLEFHTPGKSEYMDELYTQLQAWTENCNAFGMDEMQARTFLVFSQCVALRPPIHSDSIRLYPVDIRPKVERRLVWAWLCYCCCCLGWKWHGFWPIWHLVNLLTLFCMALFWMAQSPVDP